MAAPVGCLLFGRLADLHQGLVHQGPSVLLEEKAFSNRAPRSSSATISLGSSSLTPGEASVFRALVMICTGLAASRAACQRHAVGARRHGIVGSWAVRSSAAAVVGTLTMAYRGHDLPESCDEVGNMVRVS